jgi:hypothetical protein
MEIKEKDPLYEDEDEDLRDRITENEMNDIIAYINSWDYEKYQRDKEIREAFQLLKSKMIKDEKEKEKELKKLKKIEQNYTLSGVKMNQNENIEENINYIENNNNYDINITNNNNNNEEQLNNDKKEIKELTNEEKIILEKNWNNSTKIERNGQVINEKGDKDILINNENLEEKKNDKLIVKYIYLLLLFFRNKYLIIQTIN